MPNVRESKTLDPTPWISDSSICQWNLDSGFKTLVGFRIPQAKFSRIPECGFPYVGRLMHHSKYNTKLIKNGLKFRLLEKGDIFHCKSSANENTC